MKTARGSASRQPPAGTGPVSGQGPATGSRREQRVPAGILVVGGGLAVAGSVLPWETVLSATGGTVQRSGLESPDAVMTLVLGVVIVAAGAIGFRRVPTGYWRGMLLLVVTVLLGVVIFDGAELVRSIGAFNSRFVGSAQASVGIGLYAIALGAVLGLVGAIRLPGRRRSPGGRP